MGFHVARAPRLPGLAATMASVPLEELVRQAEAALLVRSQHQAFRLRALTDERVMQALMLAEARRANAPRPTPPPPASAALAAPPESQLPESDQQHDRTTDSGGGAGDGSAPMMDPALDFAPAPAAADTGVSSEVRVDGDEDDSDDDVDGEWYNETATIMDEPRGSALALAERIEAFTDMRRRFPSSLVDAAHSLRALDPLVRVQLELAVTTRLSREQQVDVVQACIAAAKESLSRVPHPSRPGRMLWPSSQDFNDAYGGLADKLRARPMHTFRGIKGVPRLLGTRISAVSDAAVGGQRRRVEAWCEVPYYDPAVTLRNIIELYYLNPDRYEPIFVEPTNAGACSAPGNFASSLFVRRLVATVRHKNPTLPRDVRVVPIEVAFDESLRNTFNIYAVRLRVRVFARRDAAEESPMVMMLPVLSACSFTLDGARCAARDVPSDARRALVAELQRRALETYLEALAQASLLVHHCSLANGEQLRVMPVFAIVTVDIPVRCWLTGVLVRYSAKGRFAAAYHDFLSPVVAVGGEDASADSGAGGVGLAVAPEARDDDDDDAGAETDDSDETYEPGNGDEEDDGRRRSVRREANAASRAVRTTTPATKRTRRDAPPSAVTFPRERRTEVAVRQLLGNEDKARARGIDVATFRARGSPSPSCSWLVRTLAPRSCSACRTWRRRYGRATRPSASLWPSTPLARWMEWVRAQRLRGSRPLAPRPNTSPAWLSNASARLMAANL